MRAPLRLRFLVHRAQLWTLASVAGLASGAPAFQSVFCSNPPVGPDVICGDVSNAANYNISGNMDAVALGTTSCNVGSALLNWFSGTINHPLMGGQVYKYQEVSGSGRFESLGQSWLKHAFTALQGTTCCTNCAPSGSGSLLGIGCSDPYGGSLNGSQGSLGPKYQANPHTGQYVATPTHPTGGNNGRIQMLLSELAPSSATVRYFGEMTYVALDDARANNSDNNISWREFTVAEGTTTAGYNFTAFGSTVRKQAGIYAWQVADPQVQIFEVSVPEDSSAPYDGEAKVFLGARVTDLGNGTWHYEYLLYNQNSERAIGRVQVPCAFAATVTNIGFRDVPYLGGDGLAGVDRDGTDWAGAHAGGFVTWATTPFATNPNSNALRWESSYNFRFDANVAPVVGDITLTQYQVVNDVVISGVPVPDPNVLFEAFCFGDGTQADHATPCPCGNNGAPGRGCGHSFDAGGAALDASGDPHIDTVVLHSSFTPASAFTMFLQHELPDDRIFHDGTLCAGGTLIRLRGRGAVAGEAWFPNSAFPNDATLTLSQRGNVTPGQGQRRYYSAWYRNASTSFCPPATANVTNGFVIDW